MKSHTKAYISPPALRRGLRMLCALTALAAVLALIPAGTAAASDAVGVPSPTDSAHYIPLYHDRALELRAARAPGCTEEGNIEYYYCPDCGRLYADRDGARELTLSDVVLPAAGHHAIVHVSPSDAGCVADGAKEHYACSVCGRVFFDIDGSREVSASDVVIPAAGHRTSHVPPADASCTENGVREHYVCPVCGGIFSDSEGKNAVSASDVTVPARGHTAAYVSATDATCETDGAREHYRCVVCGRLFSDSGGKNEVSASDVAIPAAGHKPMRVRAVKAECEKPGNTEYYKCKVCGKLFEDKACKKPTDENAVTVAALGHKWDGGKVTKRATYRSEGTKVYTCGNDSSHTRTETLAKLKENKNYDFTSSGYQWTMRSGKTLVMTVKNSSDDSATYDSFDEIEVDGKVTASKNYSVDKGSLKVTFKSSYLESLSKGKHTVTVYFIDGKASATLTVKTSGSGSNPSTGDGGSAAGLILALSLFTVSLGYVSYCLCGQMDGRVDLFAAAGAESAAALYLGGAADKARELCSGLASKTRELCSGTIAKARRAARSVIRRHGGGR